MAKLSIFAFPHLAQTEQPARHMGLPTHTPKRKMYLLTIACLLLSMVFALPSAQAASIMSTVLGGGVGDLGDGHAATSALINASTGVAVDSGGNVYIVDSSNNRIRKVTPAGIISTVAGTGTAGSSGDGGLATSAQLRGPNGVAIDASGNIYIADTSNHLVRKVNTSGIISTVAGTGSAGYNNDNIAATSAQLNYPYNVALDGSGNLFIADNDNHRIRKVNSSGTITTVAGTGTQGFSGDGGAATSAKFYSTTHVWVDGSGNLYICDRGNNRIRKVDSSGNVNTIAGTGVAGSSGDGGAATSAQLNDPYFVEPDSSGNVFIAERVGNRIRKVDSSGNISTVAGDGTQNYGGDNGAATSAQINQPRSLALASGGGFYISDTSNNRIRKVDSSGIITTFAGTGASAQMSSPKGVALDAAGNHYIADTSFHRILKMDINGVVTTLAGTAGSSGSSGDGGAATSALLNTPKSVAVDAAGNVYIADANNHRIRKISTTGVISTVAGTGSAGSTGDGGAATSAKLNTPNGIAVDSSGNLFIADTSNHLIRKVDTSGNISSVAGTGSAGSTGDGGAATSAKLNTPNGIAVDSSGNLFIADTSNHLVRKVNTSGIISTIGGTGTAGFTGDGSAATGARLNTPVGIAVGSDGTVYIADSAVNRIRKIYPPSSFILTIAGSGTSGFNGDTGTATSLRLSGPYGVAISANGTLAIADTGNSRIRDLYNTPSAPTAVTAQAGNTSASISFTAPSTPLGGISGYTATSSPGNFSSSGCTASPCTVNGLTNGTAYTFTVTASNGAGASSASAASNSITPMGATTVNTIPTQPTSGTFSIAANSTGALNGMGNVTLGDGSSLSISNGATGSSINLPTPAIGGNPVSITLGGNTISVSASQPGTTLTIQQVTLPGLGAVTVLAETSGSASFSAPGGSPILFVAGKLVLISSPDAAQAQIQGRGSFAALSSSNISAVVDSKGNTTVNVLSGGIQLPCAQLPVGMCIGLSGNAAYKTGDSLTFDAGGTLLSALAGELLPVDPPFGVTALPAIANLNTANGHAAGLGQRFNAVLSSAVHTSGGIGAQTSSGTLSLRFSDGSSLNYLPLGNPSVVPGQVDGVTLLADGRAQISSDGVVNILVPAVIDPGKLARAFLNNGTPRSILIGKDGNLRLAFNNQVDVYHPYWLSTPSADKQLAVMPSGDGGYQFQDGQGNSQHLYPSFADFAGLTALLQRADPTAMPQTNADGSVSATISGKNYLFTAAPTLLPVPAAHANDGYWIESGVVYVKTADGLAAQRVNVQ